MKAEALFLILAGALSAAETISGPIAGYVAGARGSELRAILGVPGSFRFSDPLALPEGVTRIRMAPGQEFALIERGEAAPAAMVVKGAAVDHITPLEGVMPAADWTVFSLDARSAVLCSSSTNRIQVVTGLPDAPRIALEFDTATLPEPPITAAVSDEATLVLAATSQSVYFLSPEGAPRLVLSGAQIQSAAVLRNGKDAVVADRGAGSIHLVRDAASAAVSRVLASGLDEMGQVFPGHDGGTLFVARPGSQAVSVVDMTSGEVQSFEAAVAPSGLMPLRNRDTFLISARPRQPGWIFYRDGNAGRVVFIPGLRAGTESVR